VKETRKEGGREGGRVRESREEICLRKEGHGKLLSNLTLSEREFFLCAIPEEWRAVRRGATKPFVYQVRQREDQGSRKGGIRRGQVIEINKGNQPRNVRNGEEGKAERLLG
jgi:hypothetical protein